MNSSHQGQGGLKKSSSGWVSSTHRDTNPVFPWGGACTRGLGPFLPELQQSQGLNSSQNIKRSQHQPYNLKKRQKQQFGYNTLLFQMAKSYLKSKGKNSSPIQEYMDTDYFFWNNSSCSKCLLQYWTNPISIPKVQLEGKQQIKGWPHLYTNKSKNDWIYWVDQIWVSKCCDLKCTVSWESALFNKYNFPFNF